jgi:hypothetical protein
LKGNVETSASAELSRHSSRENIQLIAKPKLSKVPSLAGFADQFKREQNCENAGQSSRSPSVRVVDHLENGRSVHVHRCATFAIRPTKSFPFRRSAGRRATAPSSRIGSKSWIFARFRVAATARRSGSQN